MFIELVKLSNHLFLCPLLLLLPSTFPSIRVFSNVLQSRWPKIWSFSTSPSNEYSDKRYLPGTINTICLNLAIFWRRKWPPTPVFLPRESHGQRNLAGYGPWGHKELDMTEWLTTATAAAVFYGICLGSWMGVSLILYWINPLRSSWNWSVFLGSSFNRLTWHQGG